jgi:hypothetical protein
MWKDAKLEMLRELAAARTGYEERYGWQVGIEVDQARLVLRIGEQVGAIVMPSELGALVLADLRIALQAGPVLADSARLWWLFVTRPADRSAPKYPTELRYLGVQLLPNGSRVVVPCEFDGKTGCPWVERPRRTAQLPPWAAVLAVTRRVAADQPRLGRPPQPVAPDAPVRGPSPAISPDRNDVFRRIA